MEQNKASKKPNKLLSAIEPYIWLAPSVILMVVMIIVPIYTVFQISFSEVGRTGKIKGFNGIQNYLEIFEEPAFWTTLSNTLIWTVVVVGVSTVIGFILAMVLNQEFKGRKIVRAVVIFPWATALIIQSVIWKYIINADYGSLNVMLRQWGLIDKFVNWTATAGSMFAWECWVGIFVTFPFVTFCVLSGLQSIDTSLYEAADVDGANVWQKFWHVTLPGISPTTFFLLQAGAMAGLLTYDLAVLIIPDAWGSPGGVDSMGLTLIRLVYYLITNSSTADANGVSYMVSCACVISWMLFIVTGTISMIMFRLREKSLK